MFASSRDVTTFVAERSLRQLLARGSESEREVVRAMMKRLLDVTQEQSQQPQQQQGY
jgi:hypothetical protein